MTSHTRKSSFDIFDYIDNDCVSMDSTCDSACDDIYPLYKCPSATTYPVHFSIWRDAGLPTVATQDTIESSLWKWATFQNKFLTKQSTLYIQWVYKDIKHTATWNAFLRWMNLSLHVIQ
jgi:hypothetical protein